MKSVQAVSGNFSQVLLAGRYLVKFPPTTNSFIIIVPNDNSTYSLSTLSSNVASVSSITSTYFITSNQFASALTNNETRNVTFLGTVVSSGFQGDGNGLTELDADNLIYGSIPIGRIPDGLITSNKLDATAYVAFMGGGSGSSIAAGTNIVTVTNGSLVTVHGTANVTQAGLGAGSYPTGGKVRLIHNGVSTSFTTITSAKTAAVAGDLIWVEPGTYSENNLLKSNVNYHLEPGVLISYTSASTDDYGIFDDRSTGTTTNKITGAGDIYWKSFRDDQLVNAAIRLTNSNGYFDGSFGVISGDSYSTNFSTPNLIYSGGSNNWVNIKASELLTKTLVSTQVLGGILWTKGEMYVNISHIGQFYGYGVWPSDDDGTVTNNLWLTSDLVECYIYADALSLNFKSWYDIKEVRTATNTIVNAGFAFFGGRHYVRCEKISATATEATVATFRVVNGAEVWVDIQKLSRVGSAGYGMLVDSTSKCFANVLHMDSPGGSTLPMIKNSGELWLSGVKYYGGTTLIIGDSGSSNRISGVFAISTNAPVAIFSGTTNVTVLGSSLTTTANTNAYAITGVATNADVFPSMSYGVIYKTNFDTTIPFDTTYRPITNWNFSALNNWSVNLATGQLTNKVGGWYKVDFRINLQAGSGTSSGVQMALFKNGIIAQPKAVSDNQFLLDVDIAPVPDQKWFQFSDVVFVEAGAVIDVRLKLESSLNVTVSAGRFIVSKL